MQRQIEVDGVVYEQRGSEFVAIGAQWPKRDGVRDLGVDSFGVGGGGSWGPDGHLYRQGGGSAALLDPGKLDSER